MQSKSEKTNHDGPVKGFSLMSKFDVHLFKEGRHFNLYEKLGSHITEMDGEKGTFFGLWAPNASKVSVIGNFNGWNKNSHHLFVRGDGSGIWEGFIPGIGHGEAYKYHIESNHQNYSVEKGDPFAFMWEEPPRTASIIWDNSFAWTDNLGNNISTTTPETLSGLCDGDYTVQVTDSIGCIANATGTIVAPDTISINTTINNETCNGFEDGSISVTARYSSGLS